MDLVSDSVDVGIVPSIVQFHSIDIEGKHCVKQHCQLDGIATRAAETVDCHSLPLVSYGCGTAVCVVCGKVLWSYAEPTLCIEEMCVTVQ